MSANHVIGLDVGSGGGRCLVMNVEDRTLTVVSQPWVHPTAPGTGGWGFDLDAETIWDTLGAITRQAVAQAAIRPQQVAGIAVTAMRHGVVLVDAAGNPLLAAPNRDARAAAEAMELADERGEEIHHRTGHWPAPIFTAPRLVWLARRTPEKLARTQALLSISDWVAYELTGQAAADPSQAGETLLFDLEARDWAWDLIQSLQLPDDIFPPVLDSGKPLGRLTTATAAHFGLVEGIPVAVGGADTQCALLGAGIVDPGGTMVVGGTTTPVMVVVDSPIRDQDARLWTGHHLMPGRWVLESNAGATGEVLEWVAGILFPELPNQVGALVAAAQKAPPGAEGILSTLGMQIFNARQLGLPVGNLTLSHLTTHDAPRQAIAQAVLEGMAYGVLANLEQLVAANGLDLQAVSIGGGLSRGQWFARLIAEVSGVPVAVASPPETSALGAAICAAVGAGLYPDLAAGAAALGKVSQICQPVDHSSYSDRYQTWRVVRDAQENAIALAAGPVLDAMMDSHAEIGATLVAGFRPKILITAQMDPASLAALSALGEVEYANYRQSMMLLTGEDLVDALAGVDVLVTEVDIVDLEAVRQCPDLRAVISCRGNPVNVDIPGLTALGVPVLNTPGRNAEAVAELTVAFLLMLARKLVPADHFTRDPAVEAGDMGSLGRAYAEFLGIELWGKTIGLIGLGAIGKLTTERLLPFRVRLLAYDPYLDPGSAHLYGVELVDLDTLLAESDFVSLHAPVTPETRGILGPDQFSRMKPGAYLVNTARAALVDGGAFLQALESGKLAGAAVDVFAVEPPGADHPLLQFPNVIATPHVGGNTEEVSAHQGAIVVKEITRLIHGKKPNYILNPAVWDLFSWTTPRQELSSKEINRLESSGPAVSDLDVGKRAKTKRKKAKGKKKGGLFSGVRKKTKDNQPEIDGPMPDKSPSINETSQIFKKILEQFVLNLADDPALGEFAAKRSVTMHFRLTDCDQEFYFELADAQVQTAMGKPPEDADVLLKMKADILDGMFTGRINGMSAAMKGQLSFSGDTSKAMALQRIQKDLTRLYSAAREHVGDPGDLTQIAPEPATAPAVVGPAPAKTTAPAVMNVGDERDEMLQVLNELYAGGLITATGGNISVRVSSNPKEVWITPSAIFKGDLRPDMMVRIDLEGSPQDPDALSASSERFVHTAIFRARPELKVVVHTHAPQTITMALAGLEFQPLSTEAAFVGEIPVVPFVMPGTNELADAVAEALGEGVAVIMQNHGLVVAGTSLRRAADVTWVIEQTAHKLITCRLLGQEPPVLPDDVVAQLREMGKMMV